MLYGDLQFFDIIIFAVIAVFIIYRLKNVLGKTNCPNQRLKKLYVVVTCFFALSFRDRNAIQPQRKERSSAQYIHIYIYTYMHIYIYIYASKLFLTRPKCEGWFHTRRHP